MKVSRSTSLSKTEVSTPRHNTAERIKDLRLRSVVLGRFDAKLHQSAVSSLTGALQPILRPEHLLVIGIATRCSSEAAEFPNAMPRNCHKALSSLSLGTGVARSQP